MTDKNKSTSALQEYIRYSRYAKYLKAESRRETWAEQVERVMILHKTKYQHLVGTPAFDAVIEEATAGYLETLANGSQRILQWAGAPAGSDAICPVLKHEARVYNCVTTYLDRPAAFSEIFYMLLCGCGVGFSVQKNHTLALPKIQPLGTEAILYTVEDTIEGWADAGAVLMSSYFRTSENDKWAKYYGKRVNFDLSLIRPKGAQVAGSFKAPGPDGLNAALIKIKKVIENRLSAVDFCTDEFAYRLRPIDNYDIIMHESDAVLSGGIRRSAAICLFSKDDSDMLTAKSGNWFIDNPQRARSNNSVLLKRDTLEYAEFEALMEAVKMYGEPGFVLTDSLDILFNPCVEISMSPYYIYPNDERKSGVQGCNLSTINANKVNTIEDFYRACRIAAIFGTLQAGYTNFKYLSETSKLIFEKEALLGVSITGFMDKPDILLNPEVLRRGAEIVKEVNAEIALLLGINPAARTTCAKPEGTTSAMFGTASGCHGHHSRRYIRHTQINKEEIPGQVYQKYNPAAVEESVWSANKTDNVIAFLIESNPNAILKKDLLNTKQLDVVKLIQQNWVEPGTRLELCVDKAARHNVSNTVTVTDWDEITKYVYENKEFLAGISFIPFSGDKDYPQAPFTEVLTLEEVTAKYGVGSLFASGLIVDGLEAFEGKLWTAIDTAIRFANPSHYAGMDLQDDNIHNITLKRDWCRRFKNFADRYTQGDLVLCNHLLKDTNNLHKWAKIEANYQEIDWATVKVEETFTDVDTLGAIACAGGSCEIV